MRGKLLSTQTKTFFNTIYTTTNFYNDYTLALADAMFRNICKTIDSEVRF